MVLGLIDFLLGGKKKTKIPRSGQVTTPLNTVGGNSNESAGNNQQTQMPDGTQNNATQNTMNFENSNKNNQQQASQQSNQPQQASGNKKSISEALSKIHKELKETNERVTEVVTDIKNVENTLNTIGHRVDDLEEAKKLNDEKIQSVDSNMNKFLSLYELINNQYNPFIDQDAPTQKKQMVLSSGETQNDEHDFSSDENSALSSEDVAKKFENIDKEKPKMSFDHEVGETLLSLDTLDIEEAASDAVPLTKLKNNTNSLVTILSWLEYLVKKVGINETRNTLRYYTETLRWINPEVFFDLDKYLRGMKDKEPETQENLKVKDHIVSLYFISKLNEKSLDAKLTKAVLQIIKQ